MEWSSKNQGYLNCSSSCVRLVRSSSERWSEADKFAYNNEMHDTNLDVAVFLILNFGQSSSEASWIYFCLGKIKRVINSRNEIDLLCLFE